MAALHCLGAGIFLQITPGFEILDTVYQISMKVPPNGTFTVSTEQQMMFQELSACLVNQVQ